jgi:hypothetical protein
MRREGTLLVLAALLAAAPAARAEVPIPEPVEIKAELELLRRERDQLEERVRVLQDELQQTRAEAVTSRALAETLEFRCRQLQEAIKQPREPRVVVLPPADLTKTDPAGPEKPRPAAPGAAARGKITAVGTGSRLVQINIGGDDGVREGQVLEVFRLGTGKERPLYLGTLRLVRVDPRASLGQFQGVPGQEKPPRAGDEVASELSVK